MLSLCQFDKTNMIPMSRSEVDALKKDECLQLIEQLGKAQPRRGVLMVELKAMVKELLFSKEREQEKQLLRFAKPAAGQGTTATDYSIRQPQERTLDQDQKGRPHAAVNSESF